MPSFADIIDTVVGGLANPNNVGKDGRLNAGQFLYNFTPKGIQDSKDQREVGRLATQIDLQKGHREQDLLSLLRPQLDPQYLKALSDQHALQETVGRDQQLNNGQPGSFNAKGEQLQQQGSQFQLDKAKTEFNNEQGDSKRNVLNGGMATVPFENVRQSGEQLQQADTRQKFTEDQALQELLQQKEAAQRQSSQFDTKMGMENQQLAAQQKQHEDTSLMKLLELQQSGGAFNPASMATSQATVNDQLKQRGVNVPQPATDTKTALLQQALQRLKDKQTQPTTQPQQQQTVPINKPSFVRKTFNNVQAGGSSKPVGPPSTSAGEQMMYNQMLQETLRQPSPRDITDAVSRELRRRLILGTLQTAQEPTLKEAR